MDVGITGVDFCWFFSAFASIQAYVCTFHKGFIQIKVLLGRSFSLVDHQQSG